MPRKTYNIAIMINSFLLDILKDKATYALGYIELINLHLTQTLMRCA